MTQPELEEYTCDNTECNKVFIKKTHNMIYCSDECRRVVTNKIIMEKYYARRDQRQGKTRYCKSCDETKLSRYNDTQYCSACTLKRTVDSNKSALSMLIESSIIM